VDRRDQAFAFSGAGILLGIFLTLDQVVHTFCEEIQRFERVLDGSGRRPELCCRSSSEPLPCSGFCRVGNDRYVSEYLLALQCAMHHVS
jgi:hypothetical protein